MRTSIILLFSSLSLVSLVECLHPAVKERSLEPSAETNPKRIILIGASIGKVWNIPAFPQRVQNHDYVFEYVYSGGFDKTRKLTEVLSRLQDKPDAIFLKECAAYFPGDFDLYKSLMNGWVKDCLEAGVMPIPATVVPVTRLHSFKKFAIDILKFRNPFRPGTPFQQKKQKAILEYNDWIRAFCRDKGLAVLDLEKELRKGDKNRYLRSRYAKVDGLHLNKKGYQVLDNLVLPALGDIDWNMTVKRPKTSD